MKNSFTLLEIILTILIASIVIINSTYFSKELFQTNNSVQNIEITKLDLLSTKIFLQKNKNNLQNNILYENNIVYFKDNILLKDVSKFLITKEVKYYEISLELKNKASVIWKIQI